MDKGQTRRHEDTATVPSPKAVRADWRVRPQPTALSKVAPQRRDPPKASNSGAFLGVLPIWSEAGQRSGCDRLPAPSNRGAASKRWQTTPRMNTRPCVAAPDSRRERTNGHTCKYGFPLRMLATVSTCYTTLRGQPRRPKNADQEAVRVADSRSRLPQTRRPRAREHGEG